MKSPRFWLAVAGICGAIGVSVGAWHAHGLQEYLARNGDTTEVLQKHLDDFGTAVRYQMYHAAALAVVGLILAQGRSKTGTASGVCFLIGVALFSGCLYAWALGGPKWLVHVVPFGGVSLIVGWVLLAVAGWRMPWKVEGESH